MSDTNTQKDTKTPMTEAAARRIQADADANKKDPEFKKRAQVAADKNKKAGGKPAGGHGGGNKGKK